jgi:signal transduction histidine kinase
VKILKQDMPVFISRKKFDTIVATRSAEICDQIISEMGAELHDDLIQKLSIFRLHIDRLDRSASEKKEVELLALQMKAEFEKLTHVVRNISRRLLPARIEGHMLDHTLAMLCQHMEHPGAGHIHFENTGTPVIVDDQAEMYLFRIVQELIHNAFKHSAAWHIWVRLVWYNNKLMIEVEDDGSGFAKIPEFIDRLKKKHNSLKMRTLAIGASIDYLQGEKGLLARVEYSFEK